MMLKPLALIVTAAALVIGMSAPALPQSRPNLTGTWIVENVDQQRPQADTRPRDRDGGRVGGGFGGGARRGGARGGGGSGGGGDDRDGRRRGRGGLVAASLQKGDRVTLTQSDDSLIVTNEGSGLMSRYTFDDRETSNAGPGDSTIKSKAHWDGVAFVVESKQSMSTGRGDVTLESRQIWSLNPEGLLTLSARTKMPRGTTTTTVTFTRVDAH